MDLDDLHDMFLRERHAFADAYPHVASASLHLRKFRRHHARDCCMCYPDTMTVVFHPDVVDALTTGQARGLVRHELAHLCEPELSERATDKLAEEVTGKPVYYDAHDIQTTTARGGTRPRPRRLPK